MTQLLNNKYKVIQEIGNGSIGKVFLCQFDDTQGNQIQVAVKQISDQTILGQQNKYLAQELNTIQMLIDQMNNGNKCDHVLQCYEIFQEQQQYYIVSEFCQLGDLYQYLYRNHQNLSTQNYLDIIIQIAKGIQYLHNINLGHRDLKPENILIRYNKGLQLVITDFGVSSFQNMKSTVGTINYMAPEILKFNQSYDKAVDIWSLGCIMHEIIYNEQLFNGNTTQQVVSKIRNFKLYQQIDQRPFLTDLNQIIQSCLSLDASYRPTIQDILNRLDELYSKIKNNEHIDQDQNQIINQQNGDQRYDQSNFTLTNTSFQTLNQNQTQQDNDFRQERTIQDNFLQKLIIECIQNDPINETQYREFQQNNEKQFVDIKSIEKYFKNFSNDLRSDEYKAIVLLHHILCCNVIQDTQFIQQIEKVIINDDDSKRYLYFCLIQCAIEENDFEKIDKFFQLTRNQIFQQIVKKLSFEDLQLNQHDAKNVLDLLKKYREQPTLTKLIQEAYQQIVELINDFSLIKLILFLFILINFILGLFKPIARQEQKKSI